ncbi:MAG: HDOD domain-containing protein [Phycisphaerales bacterium]|nr:HDOD domain-containing protein [Phycisphaerales bacterium]
MPERRSQLSCSQIEDLHQVLVGRVGGLNLCSQPEVVARILQLNSNPSAAFNDYARVIRTDPGLTGRLLKIANSAYYAQRKPVTNLDRACVLLGLERLKAFSLGFYLSRAADRDSEFSRAVWGQSVLRACLAAELARESCPMMVIEAFVIGLLLDSGLGMMPQLLGEPYNGVIDANLPPDELFEHEFNHLEFTHGDVARALIHLWRLPEILGKPVEWHHVPPARSARPDNLGKLHRIAYIVGQTDVRPFLSPEEASPTMPARTSDLLEISQERIVGAIARGIAEYRAVIDLFSDVATQLTNLNTLASRVQKQLADSIDTLLEHGGGARPEVVERFLQGETLLEARRQPGGSWIAYLCDGTGEHLAQVTFQIAHADIRSIRESLGLSDAEDPLIRSMVDQLSNRAA